MARRATISVAAWACAAMVLGTVGAAHAAAPANDECVAAEPLSLDIPVQSTNVDANTSLALTDGGMCANPNPDFDSGMDVFYSFTPSASGYYDFGTCGSFFDTVLSVHSACPVTAANAIACNDTAPASICAGDGQSSYLPGVSLSAGVTYYVRVASSGSFGYFPSGDFTLFVFEGVETPPPSNDLCENAEPLLVDTPVDGSTIYATGTGGCGDQGLDAWDVWYSFTAPAVSEQVYRFTVLPIAFAGRAGTMAIYDDCNSSPVLCQSFYSDFDTVGLSMNAALTPGQTVLIRVAGQYGAQDTFTIKAENLGAVPNNAECGTPQTLVVNAPVGVDTTKAPSDVASSCGNRDTNPLWYSFTAPQTAYYYIETSNLPAGIETQTILVLYPSCGGEPIDCVYDSPTSYFAAAKAYHMNAGQTVLIRAAIYTLGGIGIGSETGVVANAGYGLRGVADQFTLGVTQLPDPPAVTNDNCATAEAISLTPLATFADSVDITLATDDVDICVFDYAPPELGQSGVWYTFTPGVSGMVKAEIDIAPFYQGQATLFTGACGSLTQPYCGSGQLKPVTAGVTYRVLITPPSYIDVVYGTTMDIALTLYPSPGNDHCVNAEAITATSGVIHFNNLVADADPIDSGSCLSFASSGTINDTVWYTITTGTAGTLTLHGARDAADEYSYYPAGVVYGGSCGSLTDVACGGGDFTDAFDIVTPLAAGQTYLIAFGSRFDSGGETTVSFDYTGTIGSACKADFNHVNGVTVQDIFDFLTAWLAGNSSADFNHINGVTVQDIFDFLTAWLAGC